MSDLNDDLSGQYVDENIHVIKIEDGLPHEENEWCWCDPETLEDNDGNVLVLHRWRH